MPADTEVTKDERRSARLESCGGRASVEAAGAKLLPLVAWRWVDRRVEAISFQDDATVRRQVTVTFTTPRSGTRKRPLLLPLTLMPKDSVTGFDFVDEDGRMLPLLTATEKGTMASGLLIGMVRNLMLNANLAVPNAVLDAVRGVAECDAHEGAEKLKAFWDSCPKAVTEVLREDSTKAEWFRGWLASLADSHLVIVPFECTEQQRRVVRFSYYESADPADPIDRQRGLRPSGRDLLQRSIGWEPKRYRFPTPGMGFGGTYHFSISVPDGVKVTQVQLVSTGEVEGRVEPMVLADAPGSPGSTKHVFTRDVYPGRYGSASVALRARGSAVVRAAALTAVGIALVLSVGFMAFPRLVGHTSADVEVAASLLLLFPSLAGVYVVNSSEHRLATSLVYGVRLLTLVSASTSFVATGILVLGTDTMPWRGAWLLSTVVAVLIAAVLSRTLYVTWRRGREVRDLGTRMIRSAWRLVHPLAGR